MKPCIIFDCDGVLVDSEMITTKHFIHHLAQLGYHIEPEESIKRFTGKSVKTIVQEITDESGLVLPKETIDAAQTQIHRALHEELKTIEGIADLLHSLKRHKDICVASSGVPEKIEKSLKVTELRDYFGDEHIFSAVQVKNGKPAPDLFLLAAQQMGYVPQDCVVVEDSPAGIEAALAANMAVIGFLAGSHAQYNWYQKRLHSYGIPIAYRSSDLSVLLKASREAA